MEILPLEIWKLIFDKLALREQIKLRATSKYLYDNMQIIILDTKDVTLDKTRRVCIDDDISVILASANRERGNHPLKDVSLIFPHLIELIINPCCDKLDIRKLTKLTKLHISYCDNVNDSQLINLTNLEELTIYGNINISVIKNISHLTKLTKLVTGDGNLVTKKEISNLVNLTHLNFSNNNSIDDLNIFTNLTTLLIFDCGKISNNGVSKLTNLEKLDISYTENITKLDHFVNLTNLRACKIDGDYTISRLKNENILMLTNLIKLDITHNNSITNLDTLTNLRTLYINGCKIKDLNSLIGLKKLSFVGNIGVNDFKHLTNLTKLNGTKI